MGTALVSVAVAYKRHRRYPLVRTASRYPHSFRTAKHRAGLEQAAAAVVAAAAAVWVATVAVVVVARRILVAGGTCTLSVDDLGDEWICRQL